MATRRAEAFWVGYRNNENGQVDHFGNEPTIDFDWNTENPANPEPNGESSDCVRIRQGLFNDVTCEMDRTGPSKNQVGMGVACRRYPSMEVNTKQVKP